VWAQARAAVAGEGDDGAGRGATSEPGGMRVSGGRRQLAMGTTHGGRVGVGGGGAKPKTKSKSK
jgi:hypothetical protein